MLGQPELEWKAMFEQLVVRGDTDFTHLKNMKDAMLALTNEFQSSKDLKFDGKYK